jgi:hypothetical protein
MAALPRYCKPITLPPPRISKPHCIGM